VPWTVESQLFNAGSTQMGDYSIFEYQWGAGQQVGVAAKYEADMVRVQGGWYNVVSTVDAGGDPENYNNQWNNPNNQSVAVAGRAEYKVAGTWEQFSKESSFKGEEFGLLVGGGVIWQNGRNENTTDYGNPFALTADAQAKFGGFNVIGQLLWATGAPDANNDSNWGFNVQGGAFVTDDLEFFGAWAYAQTNDTTNFLQAGANWYFAKNSMKMTMMGIIPLNNAAAAGAGQNDNLRGFNGGVGLGESDNNFSFVWQLQMMF
jgi:hypothetical protein